ncbi:MAG: PAS domain-containing sensor histidine kinase [Clostridia bacterium]|nr:PAS domain-containing sensor histidine kinase [Clostridia bacterium]
MRKKFLKNTAITVGALALSYSVSFLLQNVFDIQEHITSVFIFAVFLVSLLTDGYICGVITSLAGIIAINYAFTYPYFDVDFSAQESIFSAIVMLVISLLTSALTTKLKRWQELKAEGERERMRANLLRAVSHDLRTPLTTIYGASSSILDNYDKLNDTQKTQMVLGIKEDSEWLIRMVENLLSITRIDSGKVKLIKTPTVLEELIDSVILKFKKRYPDQKVYLDIPDDVVVIPMDAILVEQVIINILENSIQHAGDFTRLSIKVFLSGNEAVFEISDDGKGIDADRLDHIFTGYYAKNDETSDTQKRNAGIGLSVCATIIKAHGGKITAENANDAGAVFRFSLATEELNDK